MPHSLDDGATLAVVAEQDIEESLRIARREHQLAVERHDDTSAAMFERAIIDLENIEPDGDPRHVVRLPEAFDLPRQRAADADTTESDEVS